MPPIFCRCIKVSERLKKKLKCAYLSIYKYDYSETSYDTSHHPLCLTNGLTQSPFLKIDLEHPFKLEGSKATQEVEEHQGGRRDRGSRSARDGMDAKRGMMRLLNYDSINL